MAKAKYADKLIGLKCSVCSRRNYYTKKNKKKLGEHKLNLKKYCKWCRKSTLHKETRITAK